MTNPFKEFDLELTVNKYRKELGVTIIPTTKQTVKLRGQWFDILGFWQGKVYFKKIINLHRKADFKRSDNVYTKVRWVLIPPNITDEKEIDNCMEFFSEESAEIFRQGDLGWRGHCTPRKVRISFEFIANQKWISLGGRTKTWKVLTKFWIYLKS